MTFEPPGEEYTKIYGGGVIASGFTVEGLCRLGQLCPWEIVGWWVRDLARATAADKFTSLLHHLHQI